MALCTTMPSRFVGCDVGKTSVVVFSNWDDKIDTVPNTEEALFLWAKTLPPGCLAVCEATGGYEVPLLAALGRAQVQAHRADARKVKAFIRSFGTLGKTDALDARALARYGAERHAGLALWQPPEAARVTLQRLVLARQDMIKDRVAYKNRLSAQGADTVRPHLLAVITCFDDQIDALDQAIGTLIASVKDLKGAIAQLRSIPGVGDVTAAAVLALVPELGTTDRRHIASLCGLAPHPKQSGGNDAYRRVRGGRPEVKRALFMAALAASRAKGQCRETYQRMIQNGKKPMVALVAIMRKIITIANARIRDASKTLSPNATQLS